MFLQTLGFSKRNKKKVARNLRTDLNIYGVESERKRKNVFWHYRVHIHYLVFLVTCSGRVSVAFFKRDCFASRDMTGSFRVWLSGRDDFRRVIFNGSLL